jgi:hypothetical protein
VEETMRIIPTKIPGEWEIEGVGTIVRNAQGGYVVMVPKDTEITEEQWDQVSTFIKKQRISN